MRYYSVRTGPRPQGAPPPGVMRHYSERTGPRPQEYPTVRRLFAVRIVGRRSARPAMTA